MCIIEKLTSPTKSFTQNANKLFSPPHTNNTQIKVIELSSSRKKLYSTFVVDSMTSNLVQISDSQKIKPAP